MRVFFAVAIAALIVAGAAPAAAQRGSAHRFKRDLDLRGPGLLEIDCAGGPVRGEAGQTRVLLPDCEIALGVVRDVELAFTGVLAFERPAGGGGSVFGAHAWENAWVSVEAGILRVRNPATRSYWSLGVRAGPRLPLAPAAHGLGVEGLLLAGRMITGPRAVQTRFVLSGGFEIDPADGDRGRPRAALANLDVESILGWRGLRLLGALDGTFHTTDEPNALTFVGGVTWAMPGLEISVLGLYGLSGGGDRYGALLRVEPKIHLW